MSKIIDALLDIDRDLPAFQADGRFHNYGKDHKAWYVANETIGKRGDRVTICTMGKFGKDGVENHTVVESDRGYQVSKTLVRKVVADMKPIIDEKRLEDHKRVADSVRAQLVGIPRFSGGEHKYLKKKGVTIPVDTTALEKNGILLFPTQDIQGVVWGVQSITPTGEKKFATGQRMKGLYFPIPGNEDVTILCEGVSTGLTLHQATGNSVWVCFSAGNLEHVAREVLTAFPGRSWLVAGDEDQFTFDAQGRKVNPGRTKAEAAARILGCPWVVPQFNNLAADEKPTDFNDLYLREGLAAVTTQVNQFQSAAGPQQDIGPVHKTLEKLKPIEIAYKIIDDKPLLVDDVGLVYLYTGTHWRRVSEMTIKSWAHREDAFEHVTDRRISQVVSLIKSRLSKENIPWRNLQRDEIPFKNGIYNITQGFLRPHRAEDYLETVLPVPYDDTADFPVWRKCLNDWFGDDPDGQEKMEALQQFFGYILMPHAKYKKALCCFGAPDSGKSLIAAVIRLLVGNPNICVIKVEDMGDPRQLEDILGKMVNIISEIGSSGFIADGGFKMLVGGEDPITVDVKNEKKKMYIPFCKHVICTNTLPAVNDKTDATYKRLLLIEFNKTIPDHAQNTRLLEDLEAEIVGIAAWAALGAELLLASGGRFVEPPSSIARKAAHKHESNPVNLFIDECCERVEGGKVEFSEFKQRFYNWHKGKAMSNYAFSKLVEQAGLKAERATIYGRTSLCILNLSFGGPEERSYFRNR